MNVNEGAEADARLPSGAARAGRGGTQGHAPRMRIALLGPIAWRTPPRHYGPWELITGLLADGLVDLDVDVTLFATLDSITRAKLDGVCPRPYEEDDGIDGRIWEALHVAHALSRSGDFDLIHNHLDWLPLAFSRAHRYAGGHHHSRLLVAADPARLPAVEERLRLHLGLRPFTRSRLRGHGSPRGRSHAAAVLHRRRRARVLRAHPPGQGDP